MNLMKFFRLYGARKRRDLTLYPPFWLMDIRIEARNNWREVIIHLPLTFFTRNVGGCMFGGTEAALADPVPAMACARIFPGHSVWTRDLALDFRLPGNTDLELRFRLDPEQEATIRRELAQRGRSTPNFEMGFYLSDGTLCTQVRNTVAIRPRGYTHHENNAPKVENPL